MPRYDGPVEDFKFILSDVLNFYEQGLPGFEEVPEDLANAILEEGAKLAGEVLAPINQNGDNGCVLENGVVRTPEGFKEAWDLFREGGWGALAANPEYGGQGLPMTLACAVEEMMIAANWAFAMYPGLTRGAVEAIEQWGSEEQKQTYLPKMVACDWTGTMNLTEPHCGTDLGLLRTKAEPQADGTYKVTGTKIFISSGEHDLSENIIHLVLARTPDAPAGTKGISMFIVPKFMVNEDGSLGARNGVSCGSLEEKMGIHGNATCVMNYDEATGFLVGEENKGLRAMFTMMNGARLMVGAQGLAIAEVAMQNAADYARDRIQGRALTGPKEADKAADPIIVHPDVRRMLMTCRAFTEGARVLAVRAGLMIDIEQRHPDEAEREKAADWLALMIPVIKSYLTDMGVTCSSMALQCYGGHGYVKEWGMEQFMRDSRIAPIYEGTNGVQAMDLVGRKLPMKGGKVVQDFFADVQATVEAAKQVEGLGDYADKVTTALGHQQKATMWLMQNGMANPDNAGAAADDYLKLMANVAMGQAWLDAMMASQKALDAGTDNPEFYQNKLITGRFFIERMMPDTAAHLAKVEAGADSMMSLAANAF